MAAGGRHRFTERRHLLGVFSWLLPLVAMIAEAKIARHGWDDLVIGDMRYTVQPGF